GGRFCRRRHFLPGQEGGAGPRLTHRKARKRRKSNWLARGAASGTALARNGTHEARTMSFSLADIFGTAPALPGAAGGLVPVPVAGMDAAFAEALKSYRAKAVEGMAPDAGMPTLPAAAAQPIPPLVAS